jgi:polysaccharide biosynthesis/export protein
MPSNEPATPLVPTPVSDLGMAGAPLPPHPPAPHEHNRISLPPYIVDPPDILLVESTADLRDQPIRGQHLVRPDGTISLGIYGSVYVSGLTLDQIRDAVAAQLRLHIPKVDVRQISVDVLAYNSKFYYVITDGGGSGEQVIRFPITGSETVLDAISQISGLSAVSSKKNIWVARTVPGEAHQTTLPVDWIGITQCGYVATNYQVMPNDRIYIKAQKLVAIDTALARVLAPVERIFGVTLLGSTTINSIKNGNQNGNNR